MNYGEFEAFDWRSLRENPGTMLAEEWMLVTPGRPERWNTMTASWGGFGHLWNMDVAFVFVRPSRHTHAFMEREEGFTLSFFREDMRKALDVCGATSGRDTDKAEAADITPRAFAVVPSGRAAERVGFEEARLVISCRKIYSQGMDTKCFLDPAIAKNYPKGDVHDLYIGAIEGAWRRD